MTKINIPKIPNPQHGAFMLGLSMDLSIKNPYDNSKKWGRSFWNAFNKGRSLRKKIQFIQLKMF